MYLNALDNQINLYSEMISLNYLPDNVPLDAKFILESNSVKHSQRLTLATDWKTVELVRRSLHISHYNKLPSFQEP